MTTDTIRRRLLLGAGTSLLSYRIVLGAALRELTPAQTAGPFYPRQPPLDQDNDLTRVQGRSGVARGQITDLSGRLLDINGGGLAGVRIEIWQCDANGRYHHPRDSGAHERDADFQGFGHTVSDPDGGYRFRTIRPVPYPGRTPHIHVAVFLPGQPVFTTQLYVLGEPRNESDFLFNRIPADQRKWVTADFRPSSTGGAELTAQFDLVLGTEGTPSA